MSFLKTAFIPLTLIICTLFTVSCNDSTSTKKEEPPELPPVESMQLDFSLFNTQSNYKQDVTQSSNNFTNATGAILTILALDLELQVGKLFLREARNSDADLNGDGNWEWSYSSSTERYTFGVRLVAEKQSDDSINWKFYETNSMVSPQEQLFMTGTIAADGKSGTWIYYSILNAQNHKKAGRVNWSVNGDEVHMKLDVLADGLANNGDYIDYTFGGTVKHVEYFNNDTGNTLVIQWNIETKSGFIIAPNYNDGEKSCWDAQFKNIRCSGI